MMLRGDAVEACRVRLAQKKRDERCGAFPLSDRFPPGDTRHHPHTQPSRSPSSCQTYPLSRD